MKFMNLRAITPQSELQTHHSLINVRLLSSGRFEVFVKQNRRADPFRSFLFSPTHQVDLRLEHSEAEVQVEDLQEVYDQAGHQATCGDKTRIRTRQRRLQHFGLMMDFIQTLLLLQLFSSQKLLLNFYLCSCLGLEKHSIKKRA